MNVIKRHFWHGIFYSLAVWSILTTGRVLASDSSVPSIIQKGLATYERGGADVAFDIWKHGGLLDGDPKVSAKLQAFKEMTVSIGSYKSCEVIQTKEVGANSKVVYLSINFKRGAVYGNFLLYRGDGDWVIQNMIFSTRPEAIMPWLALEAEN